VVGAAGGIGQPLSLCLKQMTNELKIEHLSLYDVALVTPGVAADLSHIDTPGRVTGHAGEKEIGAALADSDLVVVPAGVPRKPGMTRDDLFTTNATIVANTAKAIATHCPKATVAIISNPVNSTVPITAEIFKRMKVYDARRLLGVTTLDVVRANNFVGNHLKRPVNEMSMKVVGGHAGITILPLLSQVRGATIAQADVEKLTHRIQFGGDEVVQAKAGAGSATLSMAFAGARCVQYILYGKMGRRGQTTPAFVATNSVKGFEYFALPITFGRDGVETIGTLGDLSAFEKKNLEALTPELQSSIKKGVEFGTKFAL